MEGIAQNIIAFGTVVKFIEKYKHAIEIFRFSVRENLTRVDNTMMYTSAFPSASHSFVCKCFVSVWIRKTTYYITRGFDQY